MHDKTIGTYVVVSASRTTPDPTSQGFIVSQIGRQTRKTYGGVPGSMSHDRIPAEMLCLVVMLGCTLLINDLAVYPKPLQLFDS